MMDAIKVIQTSMDAFDVCDWTHEYRRHGKIVAGRYCEGGDDDCSYCASVQESATEARVIAEDAIACLRQGDLDRAVRLIEDAANIEASFGDAVAYRPAVRAVLALRDEE